MKKYETAILFDPELPEERRKEFVAKIGGIVASFKGVVVRQDDWGVRKLAYPIRKKANAFYTFLVFTGDRGVVEEVERNIKIFDGILRFLTSRSEAPVKPAAAAPAAEAGAPPPAGPAPGAGPPPTA